MPSLPRRKRCPRPSTTAKQVAPRKKACRRCSDAKARCDLHRPRCGRCNLKGLYCDYVVGPAQDIAISSNNGMNNALHDSVSYVGRPVGDGAAIFSQANSLVHESSVPIHDTNGTSQLSNPSVGPSAPLFPQTLPMSGSCNGASIPDNQNVDRHNQDLTRHIVEFANLDLVPGVDCTRIRNHWLETLLPLPLQTPKELSPHMMQYLSRILKSYPKMMARKGNLPPIVHFVQLRDEKLPVALANCASLVLMWEGRASGSEAIILETMKREMDRLFKEVLSYITWSRLIVTNQLYSAKRIIRWTSLQHFRRT